MKKKIGTLALALLLVVSMAVPALADAVTTSGGTKATTLSYDVDSGFSVSIPEAAITATKTAVFTDLGTAVTVAAGMLLDHAKTLTVKLYSANVADNSFNLVLTGDAGTKVAYSIQKAAVGETPAAPVTPASTAEAATTILSVAAGETEAQTVQLQYQITGTATKAGNYTDTLTFVVTVA